MPLEIWWQWGSIPGHSIYLAILHVWCTTTKWTDLHLPYYVQTLPHVQFSWPRIWCLFACWSSCTHPFYPVLQHDTDTPCGNSKNQPTAQRAVAKVLQRAVAKAVQRAVDVGLVDVTAFPEEIAGMLLVHSVTLPGGGCVLGAISVTTLTVTRAIILHGGGHRAMEIPPPLTMAKAARRAAAKAVQRAVDVGLGQGSVANALLGWPAGKRRAR